MFLHKDFYSLYFGDAQTSLQTDAWKHKATAELFSQEPWLAIKSEMNFKTAFFLQQVHGIKGSVITKDTLAMPLFVVEGDYLITNVVQTAIGVITADCLPIIIVDQVKKVVAVIHAGWKGLVNGILDTVFDALKKEYATNLADLNIFLGPCASMCCYEVGYDFLNVAHKNIPRQAFCEKSGKLFFDMKEIVRDFCYNQGLRNNQIEESFSDCTICVSRYCSFRRNNKAADRQLTIVTLK